MYYIDEYEPVSSYDESSEYIEEPEPLDLDLLKEDLLSEGMTPRQIAKFIVASNLDLEV